MMDLDRNEFGVIPQSKEIDSATRKKMSILFKVFAALHTNDKRAALDDYILFAAMNRIYLKSISLSESSYIGKYKSNDVCNEARFQIRYF